MTAKITRSMRKEDVVRDWWIVDAKGQTVGRLCSQIATLLRGKHKPWFTPHVDCGDYVIVLNADKIELTGKRMDQKEYFKHSGYPGREKFMKFKEVRTKHPEYIIEHGVKGMLPKNRLGRKIFRKLKVYAGNEHPHQAQQPKEYEIQK